jgi:feruloyl esterase
MRLSKISKATLYFSVSVVLGQRHLVAAKCENLQTLSLPNVVVTAASIVPPGTFTPPGSAIALQTPRFCRVQAVAKPVPGSVINLEVWIPPEDQWNRKFEGVGNGAYIGEISYAALANAVHQGFAAASTDTGHTGRDLSFAIGHPEKIVDWGYRAVHIMTDSAKLIIRDYTGIFPRHSYFNGCSTGGAQALAEAQRFPTDYDGVIAGDPGNDRVHLNVGFLWAFAATHDSKGRTILPPSKLSLLYHAAIAACDGADGIIDGIISDPQACKFDPGSLLCRGDETDSCLTASQVEAARKVYQGPRNSRTGEQIITGYSPGSENPPEDEYHGWQTYITDRAEPMRIDFWRDWVFNDPNWDWRTFDYDRDVSYADQKVAAVNASSADLKAFKARGGKILMYSGWADPVGPPLDAVDYYDRVTLAMGGRDHTQDFFRLFLAPGMGHCSGGVGPEVFGGARGGNDPHAVPAQLSLDPEHNLPSALDRWVDKGIAPDYIIAAHLGPGNVPDRTRPLCPYPQKARWNSRGSADDGRYFTCGDQ